MKNYGFYFYGNEVSDYAKECMRVDYETLSKAFEAVQNNGIIQTTYKANIGYWEQLSGFVDNSERIEELEEQIEEMEEIDLDELPENEQNKIEDKISNLEEELEDLRNEEEYQDEVFQWFIVDDFGAELLQKINEIVYYNEEMDMYVWGVTHWGTAWNHVLTDIEIVLEND